MNRRETKFLDKVGNCYLMRVLEVFIESRSLPYAQTDICIIAGISHKAAKDTINELLELGYIKEEENKSGRNFQLYMLNSDNYYVKHYIAIFDKALFERR